jgi:bacillithiol biosynthesis cysteine-adding enzyme BshC
MRKVGRPFSSSYLAGEADARAFIPLDFRSQTERIARTRAAAAREIDPRVVAVLRAQQAELPRSPARAANLKALAAGRTAVVATGQQVGLFLGPLYSFYKAASAIVVARALEAESGVRTVPLFWLQTEDHDFAEIASCRVAGADGAPLELALAGETTSEARVSVAHRRLGAEVETLLETLAETLRASPAASETLALLRAHYRPGRPLAAAFAGLLGALFAQEGLLILDPRVAPIAALAGPVHRQAIDGAQAIERRLDERRAALADAGFDEQIPTRPGCALTFFHRDAATGPRFRLARPHPGARAGTEADAGWVLSGCDESVSSAAVAEALAHDPLRFSTSALLRPIVQDTLLPVAAYVGGPAEVSYFAQLGPLYDHFRLAPPLVVPRARFRCLDAHARRLMSELSFTTADLARPRVELLARLPAARPPGAPDPAALADRARTVIAPMVAEIAYAVAAALPADQNLARAAERTRATVARALDRLTGHYARKLAERDGVALGRLARLEVALAPGGVPQERFYGWPSLAGRHGPAALTRAVLDRLEARGPFSTAVEDIAL